MASQPTQHSKPVRVYSDLHGELKIASAHRGEHIQDLIRSAWEAFKAKEGKRLLQRVNNKVSAGA